MGLTIWALQMMWIPFWAAGIVNGVGHFVGYRNFECQDASRNLLPIGFFIGGEELHNNHHTYGTSAKFSVKWWEFDIGWLLIRLMQAVGLAKPKRVPPKPKLIQDKTAIDIDTLKGVLTHRFVVLARYSGDVILPVFREESRRATEAGKSMLRRVRKLLVREQSLVDSESHADLAKTLEQYNTLNIVYQFRLKLQNIWVKSTATQAELVESLQEWCRQAEASGVNALREFVKHLKGYVPARA
jgi:stearoyl-CoA desaturase (delta-9 desaturase)